MDVNEIISVQEFLNNNEEHKNKKIDYILVNKDNQQLRILASDGVDEAIEFSPYTKETQNDYSYVPEWDYNFDYYLFDLLEDYNIAYISNETHYNIWNTINELYPDDIESKEGVKKYLEYCKENNVTKEVLDKELELDVVDIMKSYDDVEVGDTIEYQGYFAFVDEYHKSSTERLVYIYENEQKRVDEDPKEQIVLDRYKLKDSIESYIDDITFENLENVNSENAYITFVLGYDFLNDMMKNSKTPECDVSYDFCNYISNLFLKSEEYQNPRFSSYEMLDVWVRENKDFIQNEYYRFTGQDEPIFNGNLKIVQHGYRNDTPIALVERDLKTSKEYIVAFDFKANENKLEWGYAYYYNDNLSKAKKDFDTVINGGNLSDTFNDKNKPKERER